MFDILPLLQMALGFRACAIYRLTEEYLSVFAGGIIEIKDRVLRHRTTFRAQRVPRKIPFPIGGNVFFGSSIEFSEEMIALLSASPLSSVVLFSPASAESRYSIRCICGTVGTDRLRPGR